MHWRTKKTTRRFDGEKLLTWIAVLLLNTVVYVALYRVVTRKE